MASPRGGEVRGAAAQVLLALTNAFGVLAAAYAISIARGLIRSDSQAHDQYGLLNLLARRLRINH
jgi:hypothetical protein